MPVQDDEYVPRSEESIRQSLEAELQAEFGADIDLTESSVFSQLSEVLASVLAENQEQSLQEVYQSAFLDTATKGALDDVVSIIGIQRRDAVHATGVARFDSETPVSTDFGIQSGTRVQTEGDTPVQFETVEPTELTFVTSFESGGTAALTGDTGSASIVTDADAPDGDQVLEVAATADAHVYRTDAEVGRGDVLHGHMKPTAGAVQALTFCIQDGSPGDHYQATIDQGAGELRIERVEAGSVAATIDTTSVSLTAGTFYEAVITHTTQGSIGVSLREPDDTEVATAGGEDLTFREGYAGFKGVDGATTKRFDYYSTSETAATIRAIEGGERGNVGANSITTLPSPPAGVTRVTNPYPTGDTDLIDTRGDSLALGLDEEDDEELRERAQDAVTGGGSATLDAIVERLINDTAGVTSVSVYENDTDTDNTGSGGLPPHSFETVVFGGDDTDVAQTIFETKAVTARDYGGVRGTEVTETVTAESNGQTRSISFTRPTKVDVDLTLDLVVGGEYVGDQTLRDRIVAYIGGTRSDGTEVVGLGVGEDIRIDALRDRIVGSDTGVIGFDNSVDGTPIETTPSTTTVDGLDVVDIGPNEVGQVDATDGSITLNIREV